MQILKRAIFIFMVGFAGNAVAGAGDLWVDSAWKCYSGGYNSAADVAKAETVPLETFSNNPPNPKFVLKPGDVPGKFLGMGLSPGMTITSEVITTFHGHAIYCFTCNHKLEADEPGWTFDWAVLAGDVSTGKGPKRVRIFFVEDGGSGMVREFGTGLVSTKQYPSGIEISVENDGNGVEEGTWTVVLTNAGPVLVKNSGTGRKEPIMTFHYNKAGKVIKVEKEEKVEND
jgi:hypothetical protein